MNAKTPQEVGNEQSIRSLYALAEGNAKDTFKFVSMFTDDGYFYDVAADTWDDDRADSRRGDRSTPEISPDQIDQRRHQQDQSHPCGGHCAAAQYLRPGFPREYRQQGDKVHAYGKPDCARR